MMSSWRKSRSSFWRTMSASGCDTTAASRATVESSVPGLRSTSSRAASLPANRSASQSSTSPRTSSERSATPEILSGRPSADLAAVARTSSSASKERK
jgi:hypothetical protein